MAATDGNLGRGRSRAPSGVLWLGIGPRTSQSFHWLDADGMMLAPLFARSPGGSRASLRLGRCTMKSLAGSWNIVLVGSWNPAIINPNWIGRHVFNKTDLLFELLVPVMGNQRIMRFAEERVQVALEGGRLLISPTSLTKQSMVTAENIATKVLELLVHTPISACGINYGFEATTPAERLTWVSRLGDHEQLTDLLTIKETTIQRRLEGVSVHGDPVLNLKLSDRRDGGFQIDFNYHYDVESSTQAAERVRGAFWGLVDHVESVLRTYGLPMNRPPEAEETAHE